MSILKNLLSRLCIHERRELFLELLEQGLQNMERGPLVTGTPATLKKLFNFLRRVVRNNRVEAFVSDLVDDRLVIHAAIRIATANHLHDEHTEGPCCDSRGGHVNNSQVSKQADTDKGLPSEDLENSFCAIASGANHFWRDKSSFAPSTNRETPEVDHDGGERTLRERHHNLPTSAMRGTTRLLSSRGPNKMFRAGI
jgi:hypothetical protein